MSLCCFLSLLSKPYGWRGVTAYCGCGNLLLLRCGEWTLG